MNAVGDVADGDFFDGHVRVKAVPHVAADVAVQLADAVGGARNFSASTVMQNGSCAFFGFTRPSAMNVGKGHGQLRAEKLKARNPSTPG